MAELMLRYCLVIILLVSGSCATLFAQSNTSHVSWFPRDLQFMPLLANHEEPLMGLEQHLESSLLRVGIGNTVDLMQYADKTDTVRWGADFFSFSLASTIRNVRLKIDGADGFFGMHFTWTGASAWSFRFRALHLSAHFVDGLYDPVARTWSNGREPIPFSRNYGEAVAAYSARALWTRLRLYAGASVAVYNNPKDIRPLAGLCGVEARTGNGVPLYIACNLSLLGVPSYHVSTAVEAGVKFGAWTGRGIRLYLEYYNGLDVFGQYYKERKDFVCAGFAIDFW